jgi:hypothetical protein
MAACFDPLSIRSSFNEAIAGALHHLPHAPFDVLLRVVK